MVEECTMCALFATISPEDLSRLCFVIMSHHRSDPGLNFVCGIE